MHRVLSVQTGRVAPLGPRGIPSGFVKTPVAGPIAITTRGLAGDEQADLSVHGDAAKAVYGYSAAAYEIWRQSHPQHASLWHPGGLGENLTLDGPVEEEICIGDIVRIGTAVLQVTQPREPCFKFALRFADSRLPKAMIGNGRSGWYYRVLEPGLVAASDPLTRLDRLNPDWPISRMNRLIATKAPPRTELDELAALPGLAETWPRRLARMAQ